MISDVHKNLLIICLYAAGTVALLFTIYQLTQVILLTLTAVLLAVGLVGLVQYCASKTQLSYTVAGSLLFGIVLVTIVAGGWVFGDWVGQTSISVTDQTRSLIETTKQTIAETPALSFIPVDQLGQQATTLVQSNGVFSQVASGVGAVATGVTQLALLILVAIYIAVSPAVYRSGLLRLVPQRYKKVTQDKGLIAYQTILKWFVARLCSMAVVGILTYIGLLVLGVPYAAVLALLAFALSFVPNLGPILSYVPAALVGLSLGLDLLLYVTMLYIAVQLAESNVITPVIERQLVSTPPALLLVSQLAGGVLFGIMGLLLAAPLVAIAIALHQQSARD